MVVTYLILVELAKSRFYAVVPHPKRPSVTEQQRHERHVGRRAARFVHHQAISPRHRRRVVT
jgi:hypothetical protein